MATQLGYGASDFGLVDPYPAEDLSSYRGHAVYDNGTQWVLASSGSQAATGLLGAGSFAGVIVEGGETDEPLTVAYCGSGYQKGVAGTGGVTKGDFVVSEYAASGTDRGRFITADVLTPGMFVFGQAMDTASEDGEFLIDLAKAFEVTGFWSSGPTEITASGAVTGTVAQLLTGEIRIDPDGSDRTVTTDTAANIITELDARGITSFSVAITHTGSANTLTLAAGADVDGVTVSNTGTDLVIDPNEMAVITFAKANSTEVTALISKGPDTVSP